MKKRFLSAVLALYMVLALLPIPAFASTGYTDDALCSMAKRYYRSVYGQEPPYVVVDHTEGTTVVIHLYEIVSGSASAMGHTATWDWYYIDRYTAKGTDLLGNPIDLTSSLPDDPLFAKTSLEYNNDLALFAARLSEAAEDLNGSKIKTLYESEGYEEVYLGNYGKDYAYSIAYKTTQTNGEPVYILSITARGSQTASELWKDFSTSATKDFLGYKAYDVVYDFEEEIWAGLNQYLDTHDFLCRGNLKVFITGHSLGGAAANLIAARFTHFADWGGWWSDTVDQEDIYAYTFGAIDSIKTADNKSVSATFENIHNIYNVYDSFGPNEYGNSLPSGVGTVYAKFGHIDLFAKQYRTGSLLEFNTINHNMPSYIEAVENHRVHCASRISAESTAGGFSDVAKDSYYADAVLWAVGLGITNGTGTNTFSPNATCTKAQILTMIWRAAGQPEPAGTNPFNDVKSSDYYFKAAVWAYEKGMVAGSSFLGAAPCSRSMAVTYLWNMMGNPAVSGSSQFSDISSDAPYAQAVSWAVNSGITTGTGGNTFSPNSSCTRAQIVTFLYRCMVEPATLTAPSESGWSAAYQNFVLNERFLTANYPYQFEAEAAWGNEEEHQISLYDFDRDGTPELAIGNGYWGKITNQCYVYTYVNGKIEYIGTAGPYFSYVPGSKYSGVFCEWGFDYDTHGVTYYSKNGKMLMRESVYSYSLANEQDKHMETSDTALFLESQKPMTTISSHTVSSIRQMGWDNFVTAALV